MVKTIVADKTHEIKAEMKRLDLWKNQPPAWVNEYAEKAILTQEDFAGWLQFIYLPNVSEQQSLGDQKKFIAPQAMIFFAEDLKKGKLLQLLIELDSLI